MIKLSGAYIYITESCNLACRYCYEKDRRFGENDEKFRKTVSVLLETLRKNVENPFIVLFGGEPLTRKDRILWVVREIKRHFKNRATVSIITNGTLITDELLAALPSIGIPINFVVSLDGPEDIHNRNRKYANGSGSYADTIRGIEILRRWVQRGAKIGINIRATITKNTIKDFPRILAHLLDLGIPFSTVIDAYTYDEESDAALRERTDEIIEVCAKRSDKLPLWKEYLKFVTSYGIKIPERACGIGYEPAVLENGEIWPCHRVYEHHKVAHIGKSMGNILLEKFDTDVVKRYQEISNRKVRKCRDCPILAFCRGGCPAIHELLGGGIDKPYNEYCKAANTLAEILLAVSRNTGPVRAVDERTAHTAQGRIIFALRNIDKLGEVAATLSGDMVLNYVPPCIGGGNSREPSGPFIKYVKTENCEKCRWHADCKGIPLWLR
ncbi:MAG: radical SAM protein [Candidatus Diapherotrites archaeon]|nr:radical SAM protein [Candidatus Diapherotrites archaeon]